jgi:hypothetical protein
MTHTTLRRLLKIEQHESHKNKQKTKTALLSTTDTTVNTASLIMSAGASYISNALLNIRKKKNQANTKQTNRNDNYRLKNTNPTIKVFKKNKYKTNK